MIDDFEGYCTGKSELEKFGVYSFGQITSEISNHEIKTEADLGNRFISIRQTGHFIFGGWGKGIGACVNLNENEDYLNFYLRGNQNSCKDTLKIILQEDDNEDGKFKQSADDEWILNPTLTITKKWTLISFSLKELRDNNEGGDGKFNIGYKSGKLINLIVSFSKKENKKIQYDIDFINFSRGDLSDVKKASEIKKEEIFCCLGAWTNTHESTHFTDIAKKFESHFSQFENKKKIGIIHIFQPLNLSDTLNKDSYFSVEKINEIIYENYIPMITLENRFNGEEKKDKQPNLENIIKGTFDAYFQSIAQIIKKVDGMVLLRILHEFNGDWYPWCIAKNKHQPELFVKSFRHIHELFKRADVQNVKFIWCPNSMSIPQTSWNDIQLAYPGDEYVDYVGMDIYNGAGKSELWKSFLTEGIENYFVLTDYYPSKPIFVCETASRERNPGEKSNRQSKGEWIEQMATTIKKNMPKVCLLSWFNETDSFKINSSNESLQSFYQFIMSDDYFKTGIEYVYYILRE